MCTMNICMYNIYYKKNMNIISKYKLKMHCFRDIRDLFNKKFTINKILVIFFLLLTYNIYKITIILPDIRIPTFIYGKTSRSMQN